MLRTAFWLVASLSILPFSSNNAQTGPGGVGNSLDNGLWLRADDLPNTDGEAVIIWPDRSGNGNDASQGIAEHRPGFVQASGLNAMPAVRLDGTDDRLFVADDDMLDGTQAITYFAVLRPNDLNGTSPQGILGKRIDFTVSNDYAYVWFFYNNANDLSLDINSNDNRFSSGSTRFSNGTNYLVSWDFDGARPLAGRARQYSAGQEISRKSISDSGVNNSREALIIGALNNNYRDYLGADYTEIIHYNRSLSALERQLVDNYLSGKYAIPLAPGALLPSPGCLVGEGRQTLKFIGEVRKLAASRS